MVGSPKHAGPFSHAARPWQAPLPGKTPKQLGQGWKQPTAPSPESTRLCGGGGGLSECRGLGTLLCQPRGVVCPTDQSKKGTPLPPWGPYLLPRLSP